MSATPPTHRHTDTQHRTALPKTTHQLHLFTAAVEQSPVSVIITDRSGVIEYVNPQFARCTGYSREEAVGKRAGFIRSGDTPESVYRELWQTISAGEVWHGELKNRRRNGETYWDMVSISPVHDANGVISHFVGVQLDISERIRAQEAIRQRDEQFRELAENISEVFFVAAADFSETHYISPAYEQIWGRTCASLYEHPNSFLEPVPQEDRSVLMSQIQSLQRGDAASEAEFRVIRPDGQLRWVRAQTAAIRAGDGTVVRISGTVRDITDRRALEAQLRQAQKMEAVGRLAGGVAHNFNNVLTAIKGNAQLLLIEDPDDEQEELLLEIDKAADRAAALTQQLLAFSRRQVLQPTTLSINDTILDLSKMARRLIGEDIALVTDLTGEQPFVLADAGQLHQVLLNLIVNARDAMPNGGMLRIGTAAADDVVEIEVSDDGGGIASSDLPYIFEPFFTTKEPGKGTGLGLATVYGIIHQSGGRIDVDSEVGKGTTFRIQLPRSYEKQARAQVASARTHEQPGTETILLVEDEDVVLRVLERSLRKDGYTLLVARNGREALQIVEQHGAAIDLIISDIVMPEMGGREMAESLKQRRFMKPVLFMSGYTEDAAGFRGDVGAGNAYLEKPFTPAALLEKVREVLGQSERP